MANYFRHGAAHGYPFYNTPTVHINNFGILLEVAMNMIVILISTEMVHHPQRVIMVTKTLLLNGEKPEQGQGLDSIYSFIGKGT